MGKPTFDNSYSDAGRATGRGRTTNCQMKVLSPEYIGVQSEPGELKHLSTRRKGHQRDSVSSGERTRIRPMLLRIFIRTGWKSGPQRGRAPYEANSAEDSSRAGHVKSCLKIGGPPSKPKYSSATDSEQVP